MFENTYRCYACFTEWVDVWDCACNDKCPRCNKETEPMNSVELVEEPYETESE